VYVVDVLVSFLLRLLFFSFFLGASLCGGWVLFLVRVGRFDSSVHWFPFRFYRNFGFALSLLFRGFPLGLFSLYFPTPSRAFGS